MIKFIKGSQGFGLIGILIVIAVIALAGGGGLYWKEAQNQKNAIQMGADAIKRAEELKKQIESRDVSIYVGSTSINSDGDTSEWKTYRNEKYRFEVKYPADWLSPAEFVQKKDIFSASGNTETYSKQYGFDFGPGEVGSMVVPVLEFQIYEKATYQTEKFRDPDDYTKYLTPKRESVIISEINTIKNSYSIFAGEGATDIIYIIEIPRGDTIAILRFSYTVNNFYKRKESEVFAKYSEEIFSKIITSVKFID